VARFPYVAHPLLCLLHVGRSTPPTGQVASTFAVSGEGDRLALEGVLDIHTLPEAQRSLRQALKQRKKGALDLANLSGLDTPGALFLCGLGDKGVTFTGVRADPRALASCAPTAPKTSRSIWSPCRCCVKWAC